MNYASSDRYPCLNCSGAKPMRICYVSYEYPHKITPGGIATYVYQISESMAKRGHIIYVITTGSVTQSITSEAGATIFTLNTTDRNLFRDWACQTINQLADVIGFDLIETPDWGADALSLAKSRPDIPLIMRLHTSTIQLLLINSKLHNSALFLAYRSIPWLFLKHMILFIYLRMSRSLFNHFIADRDEYDLAVKSIFLVAPSKHIIDFNRACWNFDLSKYRYLPYPYAPPQKLLDIPLPSPSDPYFNITLLYIGRIEIRKGVEYLIESMTSILCKYNFARLTMIGPENCSPMKGIGMIDYLTAAYPNEMKSVDYKGNLPAVDLPFYLKNATICIFPSLWENFPYACLEAMAAARPIIGTSSGGMYDMLDGNAGEVIPPASSKAISDKVLDLLGEPHRMRELGCNARKRIKDYYSSDQLLSLYEDIYSDALGLSSI